MGRRCFSGRRYLTVSEKLVPTKCPTCDGRIKNKFCVICGAEFGAFRKVKKNKEPRFAIKPPTRAQRAKFAKEFGQVRRDSLGHKSFYSVRQTCWFLQISYYHLKVLIRNKHLSPFHIGFGVNGAHLTFLKVTQVHDLKSRMQIIQTPIGRKVIIG